MTTPPKILYLTRHVSIKCVYQVKVSPFLFGDSCRSISDPHADVTTKRVLNQVSIAVDIYYENLGKLFVTL
jgi:hypothetical protein